MTQTTAFKGSLKFCSNRHLWSFRKELAGCINQEYQLGLNARHYLGIERGKVSRGEVSLQASSVKYFEQEIERHDKLEREYRARAGKVRDTLQFRITLGLA